MFFAFDSIQLKSIDILHFWLQSKQKWITGKEHRIREYWNISSWKEPVWIVQSQPLAPHSTKPNPVSEGEQCPSASWALVALAHAHRPLVKNFFHPTWPSVDTVPWQHLIPICSVSDTWKVHNKGHFHMANIHSSHAGWEFIF